jgi:glycosyltransferase involved in cell wall biosynthesis
MEHEVGTAFNNATAIPWTDSMRDWYAAMDLVILPSYHEGLPYSLLEASAMEIPVIGSRIPGILDAIEDGINGILIPPDDPTALAAAIRRLHADPQLRRTMGRAGRERVLRRYDPSQVIQAWLDEYAQVLGRTNAQT